MEITNIEKYYSSMLPVRKMLESKIISEEDYKKAETHLAEKYCIKISNIYRLNDLIKTPFRVMYICDKKEVKNDDRNRENQSVTKIEKKS